MIQLVQASARVDKGSVEALGHAQFRIGVIPPLLPLAVGKTHLDQIGFQTLGVLHVLWLRSVCLHERVQGKRIEKVLLDTLVLSLLEGGGAT